PRARRFAVIRMNPEAMVAHLQDPAAMHAAKALQPKKYLVYLHYPQDLAMPDSTWCRYRISPVATTPRPAVPDMGITSDMILPILPNVNHCKDQVVSVTPNFPFTNCCFWIQSQSSLRVRVDPER
ncbi:hypothetical protein C8Q76DRAFT_601397, partial [Earliella scabrosa]